MKKLIFSSILACASLFSQAQKQQANSLANSFNKMINQKGHAHAVEFNIDYKSYSLSDLKIIQHGHNHYNIQTQGTLKLNLVKNETGFHGTFIDETDQKSYLIQQTKSGDIIFKEHPYKEMQYQCNFETHAIKSKKEKVTRYLGNGDTEGDIKKLESKPGAPFAILLDFDGNGPNGTSSYAGFGNNSYKVSGASNAYIKSIWEHVADDFAAFDVNVTTNESVFNNYPTSNKVLAAFADFGLPGWKGIAYVGSFGNGNAALIDMAINPPVEDVMVDARVASHEIGHTLGLSHDGGGGDPYYSGHGEYVPIMGSGSKPVTHWSKGEYNSANNNEDDVSIIAQTLPIIPDDITTFKELTINSNGFVDPTKNYGLISNRNDQDKFKFTTTKSGEVYITASTGIDMPNLDIKLSLLDENGVEIISNNPIGKRSATIQTNLNAGGIYYLEIDGAGELNVNTGWSDYSSLGYYKLDGFIGGNVTIINDVELVNIEGIGDNCGDQIEPTITVKNKGSQIISSVNVEVKIDGSSTGIQTISTNLQGGASGNLQLDKISNQGSHNVEIEVSLSNGLDQLEFNNTKSGNFKLSPGVPLRFTTNYNEFDGSTPFHWLISQNGSNIKNSQSISTQSLEFGKTSQTTCLSEACYDVKIVSEFQTCESYPQYNSGTYVGGDVVVIDNVLYEAKWWNTDHPTASSWKKIGNCATAQTQLKFYNPTGSDIYIDILASEINNSFEDEICLNTITTVEQIESNILNIFPNPTDGLVYVQTENHNSSLEIYNINGKIVFGKILTQTTSSINLHFLPEGLYQLVVKDNNKFYSKKLIIR